MPNPTVNQFTTPNSFQVYGPSVLDISATVPAGNITTDGNGNITAVSVGGQVALQPQSSTAPSIATSGTINTTGLAVSRVTAAAAVTAVVLQAGTKQGQTCTVIHEGAAANTITFAASGTSNVADGASDAITGPSARMFVWDTGTSLWYAVH